MPLIDLNRTEAALLKEILQSYLSDLRTEIAHTDLLDFREQLKDRERFLKELLTRLEATA